MMVPYRGKRAVNSTELLIRRSRGVPDAGTLIRQNMKLLRGLILQDNRNFSRVWSKTSKSPIMYENGKIYLENYQHCYISNLAEPQSLYKLPKRPKWEKIENALLCQSPLENTLASPSDHKPSLLALTANNWLYRFSAETGKELQRVYLSLHHKFRYLEWDIAQEMLYVKSVQNKETQLERQAGITQNTFMHLAIFRVFPLQIVGIFEINKKVFGKGVTDVVLSQGALAVSYRNKSVRLYSLEHIVNRYMTEKITLGSPSSLLEGKTVGEAPFGIPVNIQIKDCPPVLFELSCLDSGLQIGGNPWHYIYTPPHKRHNGTYYICSLNDNKMAVNGIQSMNCSALEGDEIFFHPDDSGRIIHIGPTTINVLKILGELNSGLPSTVVTDFSMMTQRNNDVLEASDVHASGLTWDELATLQYLPTRGCYTVTSSGRTVKTRFHQLDDDPDLETFHLVEYEDELDLLAVVLTDGEAEPGKARLRLHDNQSGQLQRTFDLVEPWNETFQHKLIFDKDTIIHIEQKNTSFCCHVYKLKATKREEAQR